jgi:hypothetical protein
MELSTMLLGVEQFVFESLMRHVSHISIEVLLISTPSVALAGKCSNASLFKYVGVLMLQVWLKLLFGLCVLPRILVCLFHVPSHYLIV